MDTAVSQSQLFRRDFGRKKQHFLTSVSACTPRLFGHARAANDGSPRWPQGIHVWLYKVHRVTPVVWKERPPPLSSPPEGETCIEQSADGEDGLPVPTGVKTEVGVTREHLQLELCCVCVPWDNWERKW